MGADHAPTGQPLNILHLRSNGRACRQSDPSYDVDVVLSELAIVDAAPLSSLKHVLQLGRADARQVALVGRVHRTSRHALLCGPHLRRAVGADLGTSRAWAGGKARAPGHRVEDEGRSARAVRVQAGERDG